MTLPPTPSRNTLRSKAPASAHGASLIDFLAVRFPYLARAQWLAEIQRSRLLVQGAVADATRRLCRGDEICYLRDAAEPWVDDRIAVVHEDDAIVAVDKPAHLPMHADGPFVRSNLIAMLRDRRQEPLLGLVHRLDRETSGIALLARTDDARRQLQQDFEHGHVKKTYLCVVRGATPDQFTVDAPIGASRASAITIRRACGDRARDARPASTRFELVERGVATTLLRAVPATGRTHQIRAHLEHAGHPILGDNLYGRPDDDYLAFVAAVKRSGDVRTVARIGPDRCLLHAAELAFRHPRDARPMTLAAPMPAMFRQWLGQATIAP